MREYNLFIPNKGRGFQVGLLPPKLARAVRGIKQVDPGVLESVRGNIAQHLKAVAIGR